MLRSFASATAPPRSDLPATGTPPTAAMPAWRRPSLERVAPTLVAAVLAALFVLFEPRTVDLAAHEFRAELFDREGFTLWNGQWYGGHHTPAYSVLFPPLAWLFGPALVGAAAAVASATLFEALVRHEFGPRARWGALWFGAGSATILFTGRLTFGFGVAFALAALLALQRGRSRTAWLLAILAALGSPVAGLFLALCGVALGLADAFPRAERLELRDRLERVRRGAALTAAALGPPILLSLAFPEGGHEPFVVSAFVPVPLFAVGAVLALPARWHAVRIGAALYGVAAVAAFVIDTPMGGNATRLGALFGGPLLLCAIPLSGRRPAVRALLALGVVALVFWQFSPAVRDVSKAIEDPAAKASYFDPLIRFLERNPHAGRVEIPFTRSHWEAAEVAPQFALARGWQRQLDIGRNGLFYEGVLTDLTYANWLAEHGVHYVALPSVKPDYSSYKERALVEREPRYLRFVARVGEWRIYEFLLPHPLVIPDRGTRVTLGEMQSDEFTLDFREPASALVRVRWSPYWRAHGGCVERDGDWTRVSADEPGRLRVTTTFSPERVVLRGRRCSD